MSHLTLRSPILRPSQCIHQFSPLVSCRPSPTKGHCRSFTVSSSRASRVGGSAIAIPADVQIAIMEPVASAQSAGGRRAPPPRRVQIQGPLGSLSIPIPDYLQVTQDNEGKKLRVNVLNKGERDQRQMWGTIRALLNNHILGVSEGHSAILTLTGVGYRASLESKAAHQTPAYPGQQFLSLKLGYSHPVDLPVPASVKTSIPQPTRILLEGIDKQEVNQFAAEIRDWKRPEPYKGKGIFLNDETIKLKAKKIK